MKIGQLVTFLTSTMLVTSSRYTLQHQSCEVPSLLDTVHHLDDDCWRITDSEVCR